MEPLTDTEERRHSMDDDAEETARRVRIARELSRGVQPRGGRPEAAPRVRTSSREDAEVAQLAAFSAAAPPSPPSTEDALLAQMASVRLRRTGAAWEPTENPAVTRYYDTSDDDDYIEVEELSLDDAGVAALRAAGARPRSPPRGAGRRSRASGAAATRRGAPRRPGRRDPLFLRCPHPSGERLLSF